MLGTKKNETMKGLDGTHIYDLNESQLSIYAADQNTSKYTISKKKVESPKFLGFIQQKTPTSKTAAQKVIPSSPANAQKSCFVQPSLTPKVQVLNTPL